jgi:N-acetylmuramoyl-L-alanine amidase
MTNIFLRPSVLACTLLACVAYVSGTRVAHAHSGAAHHAHAPHASAKKTDVADWQSADARLHHALQDALLNLPPLDSMTLQRPDITLKSVALKRRLDNGRNEVAIDLGAEMLQYRIGSRQFEDVLHTLHQRAYEALEGRATNLEFVLSIAGIPLPKWFAYEQPLREATLDATRDAATKTLPAHASHKSAAGRRVALSPGHGYWLGGGRWQLQRSYFFGIVEDFINTEFVTELDAVMRSAGANVRPTRELNKQAGNGESGFPKWQEAARYFAKSKGAPETVWDSLTTATSDDYDDDIRVRPLYANWRDASGANSEILVSIHNNGGGGTGTETWYDTANGFQLESRRLADTVHAKIISAIRGQYNANWPDRGVKGSAGGYGENRLATRPSILIEIAFMDTKAPDSDAMQDLRFRQIVANAISQGIADFFANQVDAATPSVPADVAAASVSASQIDLKWAPSTDDGGVVAYRVSRNGAEIALTSGTTFTDVGLAVGTSYNYTIAARDAKGNWSAESAPLAAKTTVASPYLGLWWAGEAESGWGMSITQHNATLFVAVYTYDANGLPAWVTLLCTVTAGNCTGDLYRTIGGPPPTQSWVTTGRTVEKVGTGTFAFANGNSGTFDFVLNGVAGNKRISRLDVSTGVTATALDFTDIWWNPAESGWGVAMTHQHSNIFVAWYTYDEAGRAKWYVSSGCKLTNATITASCTGDLYSVTGGSALTAPWVAGRTVPKLEGAITMQFSDASNALMTYTIGGKPYARLITRFLF